MSERNLQKMLIFAFALGCAANDRRWGYRLSIICLLRLVERVKKAGLKAKPELGIQFGAGGSTSAEELAAEGTKDVAWLIAQAGRAIDAGADMIMIESEGITENVSTWRTDVVARIIDELGL